MDFFRGLISGEFREEYRKDYIENGIADEIKEEKINKGLGTFLPKFLQSQVLRFFAHRHHELAFTVMTDEETDGVIDLAIKGQKTFL